MIIKDNDIELQNSVINTNFIEDILQDSVLLSSIREKIPCRHFQIEGEQYICAPFEDDESAFFYEALSLIASEWMTVMREGINSMKKKQVGELVDLPSECKSIENKWILTKIKCKEDGSIHKYKIRLLAKGYYQKKVQIMKDVLTNGEICLNWRHSNYISKKVQNFLRWM